MNNLKFTKGAKTMLLQQELMPPNTQGIIIDEENNLMEKYFEFFLKKLSSKGDNITIVNNFSVTPPCVENSLSISKSFAQWGLTWLEEYKKPEVSENTYLYTYKNTVENHLIPYFLDRPLISITPLDIKQFFNNKQTLSNTMLEKMLICLRGIFNTAIDNNFCTKNPAQNINYISVAKKQNKRVYTPEQIEQVEKTICSIMPDAVLILETGIRRGELLGLEKLDVFDINEEYGGIHINRSIAHSKSNRITINPPKWNSYRDIPFKKSSIIAKIIYNATGKTDKYLFPNENNEPQTPYIWSNHLKSCLDNYLPMYIPRLTSHELRHTYGTNLRRKGIDIYTIQKLLGHKDVNMTSQIYVHNEIQTLIGSLYGV